MVGAVQGIQEPSNDKHKERKDVARATGMWETAGLQSIIGAAIHCTSSLECSGLQTQLHNVDFYTSTSTWCSNVLVHSQHEDMYSHVASDQD